MNATRRSTEDELELETMIGRFNAFGFTTQINRFNDDDEASSPESEYMTALDSSIDFPLLNRDDSDLEQSSAGTSSDSEATVSVSSSQSSSLMLPSELTPERPAISITAHLEPSTPPRKRPSLTRVPSPNQCHGINRKDGARCRREPATSDYCFQHVKQQEETEVDFILPSKTNLKQLIPKLFPSYLSKRTRRELIESIKKPPSSRENSGFIYAFRVLDINDPHKIYIKIGRSCDVDKRKREWENQCGRRLEKIGQWPPSNSSGEDQMAERCHILEKLIHIEMREVTLNSLYQSPKYPHGVKAPSQAPRLDPLRCGKCDKSHREIFEFNRGDRDEWEQVIHPIIERWGSR
ncbi:hypothetical protein RhiJN_18284 [Ceratobasidium sp. AG-Ba]|nr:hypothetical protein RhiJN_18284 [Ceratobasidium sp. AG-Ba]